jgi:hypothetical protein
MQRREFIAGLGTAGFAATGLVQSTATAQQSERLRRIGVLMPVLEDYRQLSGRLTPLQYFPRENCEDGRWSGEVVSTADQQEQVQSCMYHDQWSRLQLRDNKPPEVAPRSGH